MPPHPYVGTKSWRKTPASNSTVRSDDIVPSLSSIPHRCVISRNNVRSLAFVGAHGNGNELAKSEHKRRNLPRWQHSRWAYGSGHVEHAPRNVAVRSSYVLPNERCVHHTLLFWALCVLYLVRTISGYYMQLASGKLFIDLFSVNHFSLQLSNAGHREKCCQITSLSWKKIIIIA